MTYPGGKGGAGVSQRIINQIPPHSAYVEPFAGSAAIYRHKRSAERSVLIDLDPQGTADLGGAAVELVVGDGIAYLEKRRLSIDTFVYADPPYVRSTRKSARDLYAFEMTDVDHQRFLDVAISLDCQVMISGYPSDLYAEALSGWRMIEFQAMTRHGLATECLWMNYDEPLFLHDYTHVGADYRERERIKKKARRWSAKFEQLPHQERCMILAEIFKVPDLASSIVAVQDSHTASNDDDRSPSVLAVPAGDHRQKWR